MQKLFLNLRTDRNMHLLIQDIQTESVYCTSSSISSVLASFFRTASSRNTSISLCGAPAGSIQVSRNNFEIDLSSFSRMQNVPFLGVGNFTGCLSEIILNGENLELWSLTVSAQIDPLTLEPCPRFAMAIDPYQYYSDI